jgi:hypothetical protein
MTRPDPERIKALHQRIESVRRVLLEHWDPLDVARNPELSDEYDAYLGRVLRALDDSSSIDTIAGVLIEAERDLGVESEAGREARMSAASHLLELPRP